MLCHQRAAARSVPNGGSLPAPTSRAGNCLAAPLASTPRWRGAVRVFNGLGEVRAESTAPFPLPLAPARGHATILASGLSVARPAAHSRALVLQGLLFFCPRRHRRRPPERRVDRAETPALRTNAGSLTHQLFRRRQAAEHRAWLLDHVLEADEAPIHPSAEHAEVIGHFLHEAGGVVVDLHGDARAEG